MTCTVYILLYCTVKQFSLNYHPEYMYFCLWQENVCVTIVLAIQNGESFLGKGKGFRLSLLGYILFLRTFSIVLFLHVVTVPDIIKFTYNVLSLYFHWLQCTLWVKYTVHVHVLLMYYTDLSTVLSHANVKVIHTLLWLRYKVVLLRSTVDYHLIKIPS